MRCWQPILTTCLLTCLLACAPGAPRQEGSTETSRPVEKLVTATALDTSALTGAEINQGPPLNIIYRPASLYQPGAALPGPDGLGHLENLALWLKNYPQTRWLITVNAQPVDGGADATRLAEKRQELLERFFHRKGLVPSFWDWQAAAGGNAQLTFEAQGPP